MEADFWAEKENEHEKTKANTPSLKPKRFCYIGCLQQTIENAKTHSNSDVNIPMIITGMFYDFVASTRSNTIKYDDSNVQSSRWIVFGACLYVSWANVYMAIVLFRRLFDHTVYCAQNTSDIILLLNVNSHPFIWKTIDREFFRRNMKRDRIIFGLWDE